MLLVNVPVVIGWIRLTRAGGEHAARVPALYLVLTLAIGSMVILPLFLWRIHRRRWLIISLLVILNLFWANRWIIGYTAIEVGDPAYKVFRREILSNAVLSSLVVLAVYALISFALGRIRR